MTEGLLALAKRVRRGVKLLDRRIPNWRRTIREHEDQFDFEDGECCVLGTLEHYNGRMRTLAKRNGVNRSGYRYSDAENALNICRGRDYGFDVDPSLNPLYVTTNERQYDILTALWRAEIGL